MITKKSAALVILGGIALICIMAGCSSAPKHPDWYMVTGTGIAGDSISAAQARLMAKRAAKSDAQRQLLEAAKGVSISSGTSVRNFITENDYINSRVNGVIRSARVVDTRYNDDGSCEVDMKMDMNRIRDAVR
jgi:hypothetical protein